MSSRAALKKQRREERLRQEREAEARERRRKRLRIAGIVAAGVIGALVMVLAITLRAGDENTPSAAADRDPFGAHHDGTADRRSEAGVPTMATGNPAFHIHPFLRVYVDGRRVELPADIGIDPDAPPADMAALHTHEPGEFVHNEGMPGATLGDFFAVWGVPFSSTRLGPHRTAAGSAVQMWVDDKKSDQFGALVLEDRQEIVVSFGPPASKPPTT